jgi:hypothetical protein
MYGLKDADRKEQPKEAASFSSQPLHYIAEAYS